LNPETRKAKAVPGAVPPYGPPGTLARPSRRRFNVSGGGGRTAGVRVLTPAIAALYARPPEKVAADTSKLVQSPMPGLVVAIPVAVGQEVKTGETVAVIEAMKMQNILKAERDGVVKAVSAKAGDPVAADDVLVEFE